MDEENLGLTFNDVVDGFNEIENKNSARYWEWTFC